MASPTFAGVRQRDFDMDCSVSVSVSDGEGGLTVYSCETEHYDLALRKNEGGYEAILRLNIGGIRHVEKAVQIPSGSAKLIIRSDSQVYKFFVQSQGEEIPMGFAMSKYLSSEVCGGFTGTVIGMYAVKGSAEFTDLRISY